MNLKHTYFSIVLTSDTVVQIIVCNISCHSAVYSEGHNSKINEIPYLLFQHMILPDCSNKKSFVLCNRNLLFLFSSQHVNPLLFMSDEVSMAEK